MRPPRIEAQFGLESVRSIVDAIKLLLQQLVLQAVGVTGALHNRPARGAFAAHEERHADDPLVADDGKKDTDPTEGIPNGDAYLCPTADIVPLSDDKDSLIAKVNAFSANGWTAGHTGIQWAWNLISDKWSWTGSEPDSYERIKDGKLVKAVVLMTGGIFNTA